MEGGALVAEAVLASRELAEVLRGLGDDVVEELEDDAAEGRAVFRDVELRGRVSTMFKEADHGRAEVGKVTSEVEGVEE